MQDGVVYHDEVVYQYIVEADCCELLKPIESKTSCPIWSISKGFKTPAVYPRTLIVLYIRASLNSAIF